MSEVKALGAGRFAPSPSGDLHVGNLRTAVLAWLWAKATGRRFKLRIEDLDRVRSGAADSQIADLTALGLMWDAPVMYQSTRLDVHRRAIDYLVEQGLVFECYCSRRDIREVASAPHRPPGHYPGTCLNLSDAERGRRRAALAESGRRPALRLRAPMDEWTIHDELYGEVRAPVDHFVIQRSDGTPAYNLAVVLDDAAQGVDQVTRGDDLLSQASAQGALADMLGIDQVNFVHVPLALAAGTGQRLAKRDGAVTLSDLRKLGWTVSDVIEWIGESLGVRGARSINDLSDALDLSALRALPRDPWMVTPPSQIKQNPDRWIAPSGAAARSKGLEPPTF